MRLETARGESLATARLWTKHVAGSRGADELAWGIGTLTFAVHRLHISNYMKECSHDHQHQQ
ncbi:hypothetical protein [Mesorhizobium sp. B2-8-9]|uniref:hypothetical protein n=1 Tax=Mesorhizobium sp. B2-8-9 TaxID=2589899 RepID=UPI00116C02DA|nr:hypothetical protein [Mesorhizobium sp. B2-8-9]TPI70347.1 hypothetical protein FJ423_30050 [Mesorhizobium sp. B2-8-9]